MDIFTKTKPAQPEESVEAARVRLRDSLIEELHAIDAELDRIGDAARQFRKTNFALIDGRVVLLAASPEEKPRIVERWREFASQTFRLEQRRSRVLAQWAEVHDA